MPKTSPTPSSFRLGFTPDGKPLICVSFRLNRSQTACKSSGLTLSLSSTVTTDKPDLDVLVTFFNSGNSCTIFSTLSVTSCSTRSGPDPGKEDTTVATLTV